jgi:hypothetical protein
VRWRGQPEEFVLPKLEKMADDALEMATIKRALTGADAIIQSLGVSVGPEIILKPTRLFSKATQVLVTAMEEAHVKRLICVTGFRAGDSPGPRRAPLSCSVSSAAGARLLQDLQERIVPRSKPDWVIVRPVILTNERLSRVGQSAPLDMGVHLARRRSGFPRQTDRRRRLSA